MISNQIELDELLNKYVDKTYRINEKLILDRPIYLDYDGVKYVGFGSKTLFLLIPTTFFNFDISTKFYKEFKQVIPFLKNIKENSSFQVPIETLDKKKSGINRASQINDVGIHRKLINIIHDVSLTLSIDNWNQIEKNENGLNWFREKGVLLFWMPFIAEHSYLYDDNNEYDAFDSSVLEELTQKEAFQLAQNKGPVSLPKLKHLSLGAAEILSLHVPFEINIETFESSYFGIETWNNKTTIHFGPDLIISDEIMECFLPCYSDLIFDNVEMQIKYSQLKEQIFQSRIINRLQDLLIAPDEIKIIFEYNSKNERWLLANSVNDKYNIGLYLEEIDDTGFLTSLFYRYELFHREKEDIETYVNSKSWDSYYSFWYINIEEKSFKNIREVINDDYL